MLKPGVRVLGLRPELILAVIAAKGIWEKYGAPFVITSVIEGTHSRASKHYTGCAFDIRTHGLTIPENAVRELQAALGSDFDVIYESPGMSNAHVHVELDPKESY